MKMTLRDYEKVLLNMEPGERRQIKNMVLAIDQKMKLRGYRSNRKIMFGPLSAYELIAALGIFINNGGSNIE